MAGQLDDFAGSKHRPLEGTADLSVEDFVSTGNQYVYLPYHYNKELSKLGYVRFVKKASKCNLSDLFTKSVTKKVIDDLLPYLYGEQMISAEVQEDVV